MKKILFICFLMTSMIFGVSNGFAQKENKAFSNFGGHVFTGDFPLDFAKAILFDAQHKPIDTVIIDTLGYYYFYRVPVGDYLVRIEMMKPDPNFGSFSPTYYPGYLVWQDAEIIELKETNWEYDIDMVIGTKESEGPGFISGNIQNVNDKPYAENVDVMICNAQMEFIEYCPTNIFGEFFFENLAYGDYILYPQVLGLTTRPISIEISEGNHGFDNIAITIRDGQIASFINEELVNSQSFIIYPNPASSFVNVQFETNKVATLVTQVYDISGKLIFEEISSSHIGINEHQFNTNDMPNGYYFYNVTVDGVSAIREKIAIIH